MTCKDCVHYEVCKEQDAMLGENKIDEIVGVEKLCEYFKPKSRFVELPCEVGQTVYLIDEHQKVAEIKECEVTRIEFDRNSILVIVIEWKSLRGRRYGCTVGYIGKTVFLSREEAEKDLAERSK